MAPMLRAVAGVLCGIALAVAIATSPAAARPVLFVGNLDEGTVSLVSARDFRVLGKLNVIPDGDTPHDPAQAAIYPALVKAKGVDYVQGLAISPNGRTLYVSRGYLGDVAAFDIASQRMLWRLQVTSQRADHVVLSRDGRRLFVSALTTNQVQAIDTRTHQIIGSFATGDWPHVLDLSPDGRYVYNGSLGNQLLPQGAPTKMQLTVADERTLQVVRTMPYDAGVRPFVFGKGGRRLYVQFSYLNGFREIDPLTGAVLRTKNLPVRGPGTNLKPSEYPNQAAHHGIDVSGDGRTICDAATISNYVALVKRRSLATAAIIPVGDQPAEAETSLDGRYCFVADRGPASNSLSVISYAKRREIKRVRLGKHPQEEIEARVPDSALREGGFLHRRHRHTHSRTHGR